MCLPHRSWSVELGAYRWEGGHLRRSRGRVKIRGGGIVGGQGDEPSQDRGGRGHICRGVKGAKFGMWGSSSGEKGLRSQAGGCLSRGPGWYLGRRGGSSSGGGGPGSPEGSSSSGGRLGPGVGGRRA
ncbi:hypothetical protein TIFTF001_013828 [Ficus carica]|uniref:Uncharacterized protein n=1 Tax=Ficus carica TaxID=3494 RepID=A0AA88A2N4_FICCA|nr:hypothetical protein TIFTF001_013828 [Ficus carica]